MPADISSSLKNWSSTESSNAPTGSTAIGNNLDDNLRMLQKVVRDECAARGSIASAATCDIGAVDAGSMDVTGTTAITSLGAVSVGIRKKLTFVAALTLTHNATSLILPTGANIVTAAGDTCEFESISTGWRCLWYTRASGAPLLVANSTSLARQSKSATFSLASTDRASLIQISGAGVTINGAAATVGADWFAVIENAGSAPVAFGFTLDTVAGLYLYPGEVRLLQSNATDFVSECLRGGYYDTSMSSTFVMPSRIKSITAQAVGGGGGGGGGWNNGSGGTGTGGGGGGGAIAAAVLPSSTIAAGTSISCAAGAAGTGGATLSNGGAGGTSTFGSHLSAPGGAAGVYAGGGNGAGGAGGAGTAIVAGLTSGGAGGAGNNSGVGSAGSGSYSGGGGGGGGGTSGGQGGDHVSATGGNVGAGSAGVGLSTAGAGGQGGSVNGSAGGFPGGGGGGGGNGSVPGGTGGNGGAGVVRAWW